MDKQIIKKIQMGFISLSAVAVLAACGNDTQEEMPATEDPVEDTQTPEEDTTQDQDENTDNQDQDTTQDETTETPDQNQNQGSVDTSNGLYNVEFPVSLDQAIQIFHDTFGEDVTIDQIDFDSNDGEYEYDISGWDQENEYDIDINATTGDIRDQETERDDDQDDTLDLDNIITPQEAMEIAVQDSGSDYVDEWSLEEEDGLTVYEIEIENGDDITLDATNGDILDR